MSEHSDPELLRQRKLHRVGDLVASLWDSRRVRSGSSAIRPVETVGRILWGAVGSDLADRSPGNPLGKLVRTELPTV
jgi:hypothetical protein